MLIGIDASRANREHKGGPEWYSYHLIRWLARLDSQNEYLLYSDKPLKGGLLDLTAAGAAGSREAAIDKHGYQKIKSPHGNFRAKILDWPLDFLWTQGRLSLEILIHCPDILFVPAHTLPLIHPKKSIITLHDVGFERHGALYEKSRIGPRGGKSGKALDVLVKVFTRGRFNADSLDYLFWSARFALKNASKVITVSEFSKKEILEIYSGLGAALEEKIKVIYHGYNSDIYKNIKDKDKVENVLNRYGLKRPYLLYVSKLEKKRNLALLVEAFAIMRERNRHDDHKLVLVGDPGFGFDDIEYTINQFGLVDEIIRPGWIGEEDMPYIYSGAEAFIFPSSYEGFGIPLLEAMASGLPIAASCAASIPEVACDSALLFAPNDIPSMVRAMERIISDEGLRRKLRQEGRERIRNFSWEKCARETLEEIINL